MPPNAPGQKRRTPIRIAVIAGILAVLKSALAAPVRALAAGLLALFLVAACGGGGGAAAGPGTETPNPDPELLAPEDSMRLARALSLRNANGGEQAASVFGVPNASHDPAILDVNPFADSAVALAGRRVAARETAAEYKLGNRNFPVPDDSPLLTLAVWIDPAALTSGNGREFLKIQIFISPANLAAFAGDEPGAQIHVIPVTPPVVQPPQPPDPVVAVTLTATAFHPDSPSVTIGETAGSETITVSVSAPVEIGRANGVATLEVTETLLTRITLVGECLNFDSLKSDGSIAGKTGVDDYLEGGCDDRDDVFDSDLGGNDELYGFSGNDVYRLGRGTDSDIVLESVFNDWGDPADKILIEADSGGVSVIVRRGENGGDKFSGTYDLVVELLPSEGGEVRDRLIVEDFYYEDTARVEILEFASDGSRHNLIWLTRNFAPGDSIALAIPGASAPSVFYDCEPELDRGTPETDYILGCDNVSDVFDADAGGNDELYGFSGDDVYRLGRGTDSDVIYEGLVYDGDPADKILIEADTEGVSVVLRHDGYPNNLVVELLPPEGGGEVRDRLIVQNFYYYDAAQVEFLEFASDGSRHNLIALAGNFAEGDSVALAIPDANALSDTDNEDEEQAAQVRNRFAAAFNPGPAFGDAFGKGGKSGASLESRMRAMARSVGFRDGGEDDGFAVWSAENDFGKVWFSPSRRADFGFGAAGRGDVLLGTDSFRNPFAALAGNAMAGGGEWDFRGTGGLNGVGGMGGSARFSAFGDFRLSTGLDGDVRRWADWAVRGVGADDLLNKVRSLAALAQDGARVRGAMGEVRFGDDDGAGVGFQAGALGEADAVLAGTGDEGDGGEGGEGGLRGLRSRTAFAGLSGRTGEWFGWRFRGAAHWGRTSAESSGLLESGLLWSGSYSAGVERSGMFRMGDAFGFRLSQPLRVESGMFRLRGDGIGTEASAVPTGRQLDAEVLYRVPLRGWGGWSLNAEGWALLSAGWRRHDGHSESSSPQAGALFEAEWGF